MNFDLTAPASCLLAVSVLLFISILLSSAQNIVNNEAFGENGLMRWDIMREAFKTTIFRHAFFSRLFDRRGFILLNLARVGMVVWCLAAHPFLPVPITLLFLLNCLLYLRTFPATTAVDQLNTIVLFCLMLCSYFPSEGFISLTLCFIALQAIICYFCNGLMKILEPGWRNGVWLKDLLQTESYSHPLIRRIVVKAPATLISKAGWIVILWELGFILTPFLPRAVLMGYLIFGVLFHLGVALIMGLNTFVWTFLSTYPALLFLQSLVDRYIF